MEERTRNKVIICNKGRRRRKASEQGGRKWEETKV